MNRRPALTFASEMVFSTAGEVNSISFGDAAEINKTLAFRIDVTRTNFLPPIGGVAVYGALSSLTCCLRGCNTFYAWGPLFITVIRTRPHNRPQNFASLGAAGTGSALLFSGGGVPWDYHINHHIKVSSSKRWGKTYPSDCGPLSLMPRRRLPGLLRASGV